jgi:leader peptidase (prepilin peptidase)/N-methyltransferase
MSSLIRVSSWARASLFLPPGIVASVIGAAVGAVIPWTIRWVWAIDEGRRGHGFGDAKMLAMIGAFLGWKQVWWCFIASSPAPSSAS